MACYRDSFTSIYLLILYKRINYVQNIKMFHLLYINIINVDFMITAEVVFSSMPA
jgi:hypothetical protein